MRLFAKMSDADHEGSHKLPLPPSVNALENAELAAHVPFIIGAASEHTPLLDGRVNHDGGGDEPLLSPAEERQEPDNRPWQILAKEEGIVLVKFAIPLMATFMLQMSLSLTNTWFVGRLGSQELAANSLANMYSMLTGMASTFGFSSALDTLATNGFTGADDEHYLGLVLQRAVVVMIGLIMPVVFVMWFWAENILLAAGQEPSLASMAGHLLRINIFAMPFIMLFICVRKVMTAQGLMIPTLYVSIATSVFNIFSNYFYIIFLDLRFLGVPLAYLSTQIFSALASVLALCASGGGRVWDGFHFDKAFELKGALQFARLGIPGAMSIAQDWALDLCALLAGIFGQTSLAAQSIAMQANLILGMVNFALGLSASVRVGNHLGGGPAFARNAKFTAVIALLFGATIALTNGTILVSMRRSWGSLFTKDEEVLELVERLMPVAAASQIAFGVSSVAACVLSAAALQHITAAINLSTAYLIGLPLGVFLAFPDKTAIFGIQSIGGGLGYGLVGIWLGMMTANGFALLCKLTVIARLDWVQEAIKAKERVTSRMRNRV